MLDETIKKTINAGENMQTGQTFNISNQQIKQKQPRSHTALKNIAKTRIWLIYILIILWVGRVTIFLRRRPGESYATVDVMAIVQIGIIIALVAVLLFSPIAGFRRQIKESSLKFYLIYLILGVASALWSVNPEYSLYRAVEAMVLSAAVIYFCVSTMSIEESIWRVLVVVWSTVVLSVLGIISRLGSNLSLRDNYIGALAAMITCFLIVWVIDGRAFKNRKILFQVGLGLFLVLASMSLASWWSFWFGICYFALLSRRKAMLVSLVLIGVTVFFSIDQDTRQRLLIRDKQYETLANMTGRKILWADYMAASEERPLLGFGFAMGPREVGNKYTTNTHNVFFGALMGVGWIGVAVLGLFFISMGWELARYRHFRNPVWLACAAALATGCLNAMSVSILSEQFNIATTGFAALIGLHMVFLREAKAGAKVASECVRIAIFASKKS